jgi:phosphoglycerate dehydrogenase-like enzyme
MAGVDGGLLMNHHVHVAEKPDWPSFEVPAPVTFGGDPPPETTILVQGRPDERVVDSLRNLGAIVVPWAGIPPEPLSLVTNRPRLRLYNLHHNAVDTAEMALALLFAAARRLSMLDASMRRGDWSPRFARTEATRLAGKRAVVLGYGAIGRHVGKVLEAAGMEVVGVRRSNIGTLDTILPSAQVLVIALPLTAATEGLLDGRRIELLPRGAIVVNIGRGPIIDDQALYRALRDGGVGAAGLDVWWNYPTGDPPHYPSNQPFHELPNVVMSPHVGGATDSSEVDRAAHLAELVARLVRGEPVRAVSVSDGY